MHRVVLIGAGAMSKEHGRVFSDIPGVQLVGIWNRTRSRAEKLAEELAVPLVCDSIADLYNRTRADLAVIAVMEPAVHAVAEECFQWPWKVLMEKPPGLNLPDALGILRLAEVKDRGVFVGLNRRFLSSTQAAYNDLQGRSENRLIYVQDQQDLSKLAGEFPTEVIENWMYANSIHLVDYLRFFGRGEVTKVQIVRPWNSDHPGPVIANVEFSSGDLGVYTGIWNGPGPWMVSVTTSPIRWEMRPLEQAHFQLRGERNQQSVDVAEWDRTFKPGFRLQAQRVIDTLEENPEGCSTLVDALETMKLIAQIYGHV